MEPAFYIIIIIELQKCQVVNAPQNTPGCQKVPDTDLIGY